MYSYMCQGGKPQTKPKPKGKGKTPRKGINTMKATKAQVKYFEALAAKAATEEIELAIRVFDQEIGIEASGWGKKVTVENFAKIAWEKHEISVLIDALKNVDYYLAAESAEQEDEAEVIELTAEEIEEITAENRRRRRGEGAPVTAVSRAAEAHGVEKAEIKEAYTAHFGASDFTEAKKIARAQNAIKGQEEEAAQAYAQAENVMALICFDGDRMNRDQHKGALEKAAVAMEGLASVAQLASQYAAAHQKKMSRILHPADYRAWEQNNFAMHIEEAYFTEEDAHEIAAALRKSIR